MTDLDAERSSAPRVPEQRPGSDDRSRRSTPAVVEQAKGAVAFRYSVDCDTALGVLEVWSAASGRELESLASALVHGVCQGSDRVRDGSLVPWLQERLREPCPEVHLRATTRAAPVRVVVDHSYSSLDDVVAGARRAARHGVPLELTVEEQRAPMHGQTRAHLIQQVDLAVELVRAIEPGLEVRLPACDLLAPS